MTNEQIFKIVDQSSAWLEKMFFLPMCSTSSELNEFLRDLDKLEIKTLFPLIPLEEWKEYKGFDGLDGLLWEYNYSGWIVEVAIPHRDNFRFKDDSDKYSSCSVYPGITTRVFVYCETFEELIPKIQEVAAETLKDDIAAFKKNQDKKQADE